MTETADDPEQQPADAPSGRAEEPPADDDGGGRDGAAPPDASTLLDHLEKGGAPDAIEFEDSIDLTNPAEGLNLERGNGT
jgi:hypothetical protein